jgi:DNA-binding transcriptional regulator LsrR (DeoR family)
VQAVVTEPAISDAEEALLLRTAWLYHVEGLTQSDVAAALDLPRARVVKLLREGFERGYVSIHLSHYRFNCLNLEADLTRTFELAGAVVIPTPQQPEALPALLGRAAADYLPKVLKDGMTLGTAWGLSILETAKHFRPHAVADTSVVMMLGGIPGSLPAVNPNDIARLFAERLGSRTFYLCAPVLVERAETRTLLLSDRSVQTPLALAKAAQVALLGVGTCDDDATLARTGVLSSSQLAELRAKGAVGDVLARFFDRHGQPVRTEFDERVVGLELDDLRAIPTTILVAGGPSKVGALLGALRGGYANTLVTDEATAQALLAQVQR